MNAIANKDEIQEWLNKIFVKEQYLHLSIDILEKAEKGAGFLSEVFFVSVRATNTINQIVKTYDLVVKCSPRAKSVREKTPIKKTCLNEIYFYNVVYPNLVNFHKMRNVEKPFIGIPKCYGTYCAEDVEVLVLQNLKTSGYRMWDQKNPVTRKHIEIIIENYAKFHAISIAMKHQEPERFHKLADNLFNPYGELGSRQFVQALVKTTENVYNSIKNKVDVETALKWKKLIEEVPLFFEQRASSSLDGMNVILHGDNWNNNFLHQYDKNNEVTNSAIIDWQLARISSPIFDISPFLFCCISEEDINDLDNILEFYYKTFCDYLTELGSSSEICSVAEFFKSWKKYGRSGLIVASMIHKFAYSDVEDLPDLAKNVENKNDLWSAFSRKMKNSAPYEERMIYLIKGAEKCCLL